MQVQRQILKILSRHFHVLFFQITKQPTYIPLTPWRGYPQLADSKIKHRWSYTWWQPHSSSPASRSRELCGLMRSSALLLSYSQAKPGAALSLHLHGLALDSCSFSCAALWLLGPVTMLGPLTDPAQHQPEKMNGLLPGYQVELLKWHSPKCQNQQNGQVWGWRAMKSSGQVQHWWSKREEPGQPQLVHRQLGQLGCTTQPQPGVLLK